MEALRILRKSLPGKKSGRRKRIEVAQVVAEAIFLRWRVGPYGWKLKHLVWYFYIHIRTAKAASRYEHWRAVRSLLERTEGGHLVTKLAGRANADYIRQVVWNKNVKSSGPASSGARVTNPNTVF